MSEFKTALFVGAIGGMLVAPFVLLVAWLPLRRKSEADEISHEQRMAVLRNTAIVVVLAVAGISGAYLVFNEEGALPTESSFGGGMGGGGTMPGGTAALPDLPAEVAGLAQSRLITGAEAADGVASMNPGGQFPVAGAIIGTYAGDGATADVRVLALPAPEMAQADVQTMVQMFSGGQMLLGKAKEVSPGVYRTDGPSSSNYFFASGSNVWWVEASTPELAEQALAQIQQLAG